MKQCLYFLVLFFFPVSLFSQTGINGWYCCYDGSSLYVAGETLTFYPSSLLSTTPQQPSVCSIARISKTVYEIIPAFTTNVLTDYTVSYNKQTKSAIEDRTRDELIQQKTGVDYLTVSFEIPYDKPLRIICSAQSQSYEFIYSTENHTLRIPKDSFAGGFFITFSPTVFKGEDLTGLYHGRVEAQMDVVINGSPDNVSISIPCLDASFFESYQIESGFLLKKKNNLSWLGRSYFPCNTTE